MDRRRFSRMLLGGLGASALGSWLPGTAASAMVEEGQDDLSAGSPASSPPGALGGESLRIDGERLLGWLEEMSRFGRRSDGGVDRVAFSDANLAGRAYVVDLMEAAGLAVRVDEVGNLLGRREGADPTLPPLLFGSHIDSVPAGGNYDGALGVLAALEGVATLNEAGRGTRHPLEVVVFVNEEDGKTGSRAMAGEVRPGELGRTTASGYAIAEGIRRLGGDPDRLGRVRREEGSVAGYVELHVEQGAVLEETETTIGVVEGIVGIRRWTATVQGLANHAGTTPMDRRKDALLSGARLVQAVNRAATAKPGSQVATVGRIEALPGAPNVIPGEVRMSVEVRALAMETIDEVYRRIREEARTIEAEEGTPISLEEFYVSRAAPSDPRFRGWVEEVADEIGVSHRRMPSGAGHDAQSVARFAPMGMIFVPSVGGISHAPDEYSRPGDIEAGANVLLGTVLRADRALGG